LLSPGHSQSDQRMQQLRWPPNSGRENCAVRGGQVGIFPLRGRSSSLPFVFRNWIGPHLSMLVTWQLSPVTNMPPSEKINNRHICLQCFQKKSVGTQIECQSVGRTSFEPLFSQLDNLVRLDPNARSRFLTLHKSSVHLLLYISVHERVFRPNCAHRLNRMRGGLSLHSPRIDRSATQPVRATVLTRVLWEDSLELSTSGPPLPLQQLSQILLPDGCVVKGEMAVRLRRDR
jgi:hypothetical protein